MFPELLQELLEPRGERGGAEILRAQEAVQRAVGVHAHSLARGLKQHTHHLQDVVLRVFGVEGTLVVLRAARARGGGGACGEPLSLRHERQVHEQSGAVLCVVLREVRDEALARLAQALRGDLARGDDPQQRPGDPAHHAERAHAPRRHRVERQLLQRAEQVSPRARVLLVEVHGGGERGDHTAPRGQKVPPTVPSRRERVDQPEGLRAHAPAATQQHGIHERPRAAFGFLFGPQSQRVSPHHRSHSLHFQHGALRRARNAPAERLHQTAHTALRLFLLRAGGVRHQQALDARPELQNHLAVVQAHERLVLGVRRHHATGRGGRLQVLRLQRALHRATLRTGRLRRRGGRGAAAGARGGRTRPRAAHALADMRRGFFVERRVLCPRELLAGGGIVGAGALLGRRVRLGRGRLEPVHLRLEGVQREHLRAEVRVVRLGVKRRELDASLEQRRDASRAVRRRRRQRPAEAGARHRRRRRALVRGEPTRVASPRARAAWKRTSAGRPSPGWSPGFECYLARRRRRCALGVEAVVVQQDAVHARGRRL